MSNYILLKQSNEENCNVTNNEIVQKLWKMADVLRDDGISYQNYVTELTYILFLKMMKLLKTLLRLKMLLGMKAKNILKM